MVKLVLPEPETPALLKILPDWPHRISSELSAVEVVRAARRASKAVKVLSRAREVVASVHLIKFNEQISERASLLEPVTLRSLDAIHLASALSVQPEIGAIVVYDSTLAGAAEKAGLTVLQPR